MINEVAIEITFPLSPPVKWGQGRLCKNKKSCSCLAPPSSVVHSGVALSFSLFIFIFLNGSCVLFLLLLSNTFQSGEEKGWGWRGRHFQLMIISACVCVSHKLWVCSLATFYGKVSFPPLCSSLLPDPDRARCFRAPSEWMRAEIRRRWFQSAATGRGRVHVVSEVEVKAGCALSIPLPFLEWFWFYVSWFWRAHLDFERGGSRLGLDSGASWSVELKSCMTWAASSLCQKTGEMLLRGQCSVWFMATKQMTRVN